VIRERNGGHLIVSRCMNKVVYPTGSVEKAVVGMVMDMDKLGHRAKNQNSAIKKNTPQLVFIVTTLSTEVKTGLREVLNNLETGIERHR
jgi:hypothetical protein